MDSMIEVIKENPGGVYLMGLTMVTVTFFIICGLVMKLNDLGKSMIKDFDSHILRFE